MQQTIEVRAVRGDEHAEAGAVTAHAYEEFLPEPAHAGGWQAYLERLADVADRAQRALVLVALVDGSIAGTATLELEARINPESLQPPLQPEEAHLRMLAVHPHHRRCGIGRALVLGCIEEARRRGKTRLTLDTTEAMTAARQLYEDLGFRCVGTTDRIPGLTMLVYELPLQT